MAGRPASPLVHRFVFGRSRRGRELVAFRAGPQGARHRILVVGVIHGNEAAGAPIALALLRVAPLASTELVVVPDLNPDGVATHRRQNAAGVDLNRNFPYRWTMLGRRGDQQYSGTGPLSEPESRAMAAVIQRFQPTVSVWFHQPEAVVDESGGSGDLERRFAHVIGLPMRRLTRYPGSVASWQNTAFPDTTAFVVELPRHVDRALRARIMLGLVDLEQRAAG